jgi:hypothetical protein
LEVSNKVLAVTGGLEIYARKPGTVWTRLSAFADVGTNVIYVLDANGWKVGD